MLDYILGEMMDTEEVTIKRVGYDIFVTLVNAYQTWYDLSDIEPYTKEVYQDGNNIIVVFSLSRFKIMIRNVVNEKLFDL